MKENGGVLGFLYRANLPPLPAARPPTDIPQSKVFRGIGIASLHTTLVDSRDDVHFALKASPFGTQSHGHNAQNSFFLNAYGEALWAVYDLREIWRNIGPRVAQVIKEATPGRNDPCSCGSGKKFKKCCGA